ncbi:MFS transporter [Glacieibacterium frigidum]|uniref:MFS transporter n=1 Tax=Glacieibacterium frigidum TaxID=2593303 RepID=A0A552UGH8_9SPHN|nr:MFS transporter [Glacieibacterium frigidum]TRW17326.1 MFS transporter [Glacieibacterium frigidum]
MNDATAAPPAAPADRIPAKAWAILVLLSLESIIAIIDRQNISALKTTLKSVFSMTDTDYSYVVNAFLIPYAIFYLICGHLVDKYGSRRTLSVFVIIWSSATIACGFAKSLPELIAYRAIIGAAEAGLLPASLFALVRWFPKAKMGTVGSLRSALQSVGPIVCMPVVVYITLTYSWHYAFLVPGVIGLAFGVIWFLADTNPPTYRDAQAVPETKPKLTAIFRNKMLWGILLARLISDPLWFFISYWQAGYLQEELGLSLADLGRLLWIPPLVASLAMIVVGLFSDRLVARAGLSGAASRIRIMQGAALLAPLVVVIPFVRDLTTVMVLLTTAYFMSYLWLVLANILVTDMFRGQGMGAAVGVVNMCGTVGASIFTNYVGGALDTVGYVPVFIVLACLHPIAAVILQIAYRRTHLAGRGADLSLAAAPLAR